MAAPRWLRRVQSREGAGIAVGVALLLLLAGCGKDEAKAKQAAAPPPPPTVVVADVVQKTVPIYSEFVARTDAKDTVEIRARVEAFLVAAHFVEGAVVEKGQVLFTLDKRDYEAQLQQAKAQLDKAEADLAFATDQATVESAKANVAVAVARLGQADTDVNRLRPLAELQAVPRQDYDNALANQEAARAEVVAKKATLETILVNQRTALQQAKAAVEAGKAAVARAELSLSYCTITSPINGLIGKREVAPGNLVGKNEATLLAIASTIDPIRVYTSVNEAEYTRFTQPGRKGGVELELVLGDGSVYPHKGRVAFWERAIDVKTGTLGVIAEFPNPGGRLRPGQFGRIRAAADVAENAILVPQIAVQEVQGAKSVLVVGADNMVALRTITPAEKVGDLLIVKDGVKPGDRVVVEGVQKARPGTTVNPTTASAAAAAAATAQEETREQPAEAKSTAKAHGK